ncbi:hypothetical protein VNO77_33673 [Canavalia gladiata]|uniref:CNNM transmembrane domain-containing protein n=1 Tax=Canavalia gladiata TaxID=3824 RepID=A0AAN9PXX6_CANGL
MKEYEFPCCELYFWVFLIICLVLVSLAGIVSGLALGLLSFSQVDLEVLIKAGRPRDRKHAERIQPFVKNGHFVLCTLLLGKSLAMEALPIFMDSIIPSWFTILMSAPLVTVFAEILPQAVCSRYGLTLGAMMAPFVQLLLLIFFPITYPASKVLDWALGKEHSVLLRRSELKTYVDLHANEAGKGGELSHHETSIITGAMDLTQKTAKDAMTPISETFSLDINSKLDMHTMTQIMSKGHSRIPVHSGHPRNVIGLILVKNLIFCRPEDETPMKNLIIRKIPRVYESWPLYEILNQFQKGHSHMAIVLKSNKDKENTTAHAVGTPTFLNIITNKISNPVQVTGESNSTFVLETSQRSSIYESTTYYSDVEFQSPTLQNVMELDKEIHQESSQWEPENGYFSQEKIESLSAIQDEEVIGIITMEDVMEQLLQGDILDETDQYVHVQKNIRINLLQSLRSQSRSSRRASGSEAMKTLICASNPALYLSKFSPPWKPKFPTFYPAEKLNHPLSTIKPHASTKGFSSSRPSSVEESDVTNNKKPIRGKNNGDDELPKEVMYRITGRILFAVGVPMGLGLAFLHLFGELKDAQVWDAPLWVPFLTTFLTFGASTIGIAYGALSTSLDAEKKGSFLGLEQVQKNWVEMWQEEDAS